MGGAAALGLARAGRIAPEDITVTARHDSTLAKFRDAGIRTSLSNVEAVEGADVVIIAVKPWIVPEVCAEIGGKLDSGRQIVVCMAPGVKPDDLAGYLSAASGCEGVGKGVGSQECAFRKKKARHLLVHLHQRGWDDSFASDLNHGKLWRS